ncbi:hypothetical protein HN662_03595, partial [Candidatus Woesearchaeota archaeon]|nr:hypothetical protein [Candidatus Woesearchaeota archaeon]
MATNNKKLKFVISLIILVTFFIAMVWAADRTFYVKEGDFVNIHAKAIDPDNDDITYTYSEPLDNKGEWQTTLDDAGDYQIEVIASDGIEQTVQSINLIVENTNQAPKLKEKKITTSETETIDLKKLVEDPDGDIIEYNFKLPFDEEGKWQTSYTDAGTKTVGFTATDGELELKATVEITILQTNEPPKITESFSVEKNVQAKEDETFSFYAAAKDGENDPITFLWEIDDKTISTEREGEYFFDYDSEGEHSLVLTISDGLSETKNEWKIITENKNRKPINQQKQISVNEGEKIVIDFPKTDEDGDVLTYEFEKLLDENGEWQTGFEDAGKYTIEITANDGELSTKDTLTITILDIDRAPVLTLPEILEVKENEKLIWNIETYDPDGDSIKITINN